MGGKGSGGARTGAGRKRKTEKQRWLSGNAGKRGLSLVQPPEDAGQKKATSRARAAATESTADDAPTPPPAPPAIGAAGEVPALLMPDERDWWLLFAPLAVANGTLTDQTKPGFMLLCQTAADAAEIRRDIRERGILTERKALVGDPEDPIVETMDVKAHPLWPSYRGLKARLEMLMARYGLAPMGKAAEGEKADEDDERNELRKLMAIR